MCPIGGAMLGMGLVGTIIVIVLIVWLVCRVGAFAWLKFERELRTTCRRSASADSLSISEGASNTLRGRRTPIRSADNSLQNQPAPQKLGSFSVALNFGEAQV